MNKDFHKTFDTCPHCGSDQRFLQELGKELKERGLARPAWNMHYDFKQGIAVDQNRAILAPIGITLPGYIIMTDICMECGAVYATEIRRIEGRTQAVPLPKGNQPHQPLSLS